MHQNGGSRSVHWSVSFLITHIYSFRYDLKTFLRNNDGFKVVLRSQTWTKPSGNVLHEIFTKLSQILLTFILKRKEIWSFANMDKALDVVGKHYDYTHPVGMRTYIFMQNSSAKMKRMTSHVLQLLLHVCIKRYPVYFFTLVCTNLQNHSNYGA